MRPDVHDDQATVSWGTPLHESQRDDALRDLRLYYAMVETGEYGCLAAAHGVDALNARQV